MRKEQIVALLDGLKNQTTAFADVIQLIETHYRHQPAAFTNGGVHNEATLNQGSAKVFAFAQLNHLSVEDTLLLFAEHYRSVLSHPNETDHQNIRQFMANGWAGIMFESPALQPK